MKGQNIFEQLHMVKVELPHFLKSIIQLLSNLIQDTLVDISFGIPDLVRECIYFLDDDEQLVRVACKQFMYEAVILADRAEKSLVGGLCV